jgi:hypothetical protein
MGQRPVFMQTKPGSLKLDVVHKFPDSRPNLDQTIVKFPPDI